MAVTMKLKFASLGNAIRLDTGSTGVSSTALTISETGLISAAWSMPYQVGVRRFEYTPNNDDKFTADDIIFTGDKELIIKGASSYGNLVDVRNFADNKLLVYFQSPEREGAPLGIAQLVDKNNSTIGPNFHPVAATYHSSLVEVNGKINYTTGYPVINPRIYSIEATSSGLSQGGSTTVSNENLYFWDSGAASLDDKTQVYVWSDNRNTNYQSLYFAKSDGINITKPLSVLVNLSDGVETSAKFELAAVKNGFAIMFHKNFGEGFYGDLYLQIYNNDATARTAPIQISDTVRTSSNWHPTKIFEIDGGKIVTVFNNNQYRIFDASGNKLSDILTDSAFSGTGSVIATKGGFLSATPDYYSTNLHARELAHEWTGDAEANRIEGSDLRDFMSAGAGNDTLFGRGGDDELNGDLGDDLLDGGVGADTMRGGAGSDRFIVDNAKDTIIEYSGDAGTDTVTVAFSYTLSDGVENLELAGSAAIDGTGNALANTLVGNKAANTLRGGAGDDILDGGAGNDILEGGLGNDRYVIDSLRDVVSERANEGIDTIVSSLTYTLAAEFERLELVGAAKINGTGNAAANTLVGNLADNILRGGDGDDVLEGGAGNDTLYGSFETDASSGRDTLRGGAGNDIMFGGSGSDTYDGGGGIDTVLFKIALDGSIDDGLTLDLADSGKNRGQAEGETYVDVEVFKLTNGNDRLTADLLSSVSLTVDGRSGNDIIKTAAGDDVLDGGAGADRLEGGAGDDTYVVDDAGDVVVEAQEGGFDVIYSSVSYTLTNDTIEQIWLTGYGDIDVTGVAGNDVLSGNLGNNVLDGRQGADSMFGLSGDDTFIVDDVEDFTQENGGEGTDTVVASISYTLAAGQEIERLKLAASTGTVGLTLIGNEFAQTLTGNGGANVLDGKGGADTLIGGGGSDTYTVDNSRDQVIEAVGGGRDTVGALISYKLAAGQEIETLRLMLATGKQNLNLTGNEFGQALIGNDGNNTLDGRGGADVMTGARGNDTYSVDSSADRVVEGVGGGIDRVVSLSHYRLAAGQEIETLQLSASTGTEKFNLIGNEFGQALIGNAGANSLEGKGGNDVLTGGQGADSFIFASALGADNVDRITDFSTVDTIRLSKSIFSALAAGELKANEFKDIARAKVDADDHILYDSRSGALFYDADGSGKVAAVKFAVLDNKAAITHADFLIV